MNYHNWINAVCAMLEYPVVDPNSDNPTGTIFDRVYRRCIEYVENRMQRDLDFIATTTVADGTMSANSRTVTLPIPDTGPFVVVSQISPIVGGIKQQPLEPVSRMMLDYFWPSELSPGANILPSQWTPNDQTSIIVGPAPDQNYAYEVVGTTRFMQMSSDNTTNFLTLYLPDLYIAASMQWFFGYQGQYGGQMDDPQAAMSWENQYQLLLKSATVEEARKRYADMFPHPSDPAPATG